MLTSNSLNNKKLRYLVVMPRLVHNIGDGYSFPLGIAYISSSIKSQGHLVYTLNLNHREGSVFDIISREIRDKKIDVIFTGGLSFQYATIREVISAAKQTDNKIIVVVGGGIITSDPETAMEALESVDFGVIGEGELTVQELCNVLENNENLAGINGLIYKENNHYWITPPREEIMDLDSLPWPDYEGFELEKYLLSSPSISGINKKNTVFMIASRSCPYNCTFCFHTVGKKYRQRSLDSFFEELEFLVSKYNIDFVCLADELFSVNPKRVKEFCDRIHSYNLNWWAQFRVDQITKNPELLPMIKEAGCTVMSFGLESADNRILKSMRKNITIEQTENALKKVYEAGIAAEGAFIFGDIEETWETASNTFKWWREHSEYKITLNLITIYPGSYLYKYACANGIINDKVQFLRNGCPQVNVSKLSDSEYAQLIREILFAPMALTKALSNVEVKIIDPKTGRISLTGTCIVCGERTNWDDIKLFSSSFIACHHCGQRYNMNLPDSVVKIIDENVTKLLNRSDKIAIWGINYHTANLFKKSTVLKNDNIYPVDISELKQKMDLYGMKINSPSILNSENIEMVIVPIPAYINEITERIKSNYKNVKKVIDICELINPTYLDTNIENDNVSCG